MVYFLVYKFENTNDEFKLKKIVFYIFIKKIKLNNYLKLEFF